MTDYLLRILLNNENRNCLSDKILIKYVEPEAIDRENIFDKNRKMKKGFSLNSDRYEEFICPKGMHGKF